MSDNSILEAIEATLTWRFLVGVGLMIGGTVFQNVGLGLMKLNHIAQSKIAEEARRPYYCSPRWWCAFLCFICGAVMDFVALGFLPASVALPLGALGLVVSAWFAAYFCKERYTCRDKIGTVFIIVGSWAAVLFSSKTNVEHTADALMLCFLPWTFSGIYVILSLVWVATLLVARRAGLDNALVSAFLPGSIAAFGNIGGKGSSELVMVTAAGNNQFIYVFTYAFIVFTAVSLVLQNHFLQKSLAEYDQVIVVPVYYVCVCMFSVIGGVMFFGEWSNGMSVLQGCLFMLGIAFIFFGVYLLTKDHLRGDSFVRKTTAEADAAAAAAAAAAAEAAVIVDGAVVESGKLGVGVGDDEQSSGSERVALLSAKGSGSSWHGGVVEEDLSAPYSTTTSGSTSVRRSMPRGVPGGAFANGNGAYESAGSASSALSDSDHHQAQQHPQTTQAGEGLREGLLMPPERGSRTGAHARDAGDDDALREARPFSLPLMFASSVPLRPLLGFGGRPLRSGGSRDSSSSITPPHPTGSSSLGVARPYSPLAIPAHVVGQLEMERMRSSSSTAAPTRHTTSGGVVTLSERAGDVRTMRSASADNPV